jgi:FdhE protein
LLSQEIMPSEVINTVDPIQERLNALVLETPSLADVARHYGAILPILRDVDLHVGTIPLTPEDALDKRARGEPLLFNEALDIDPAAFRSLMIDLARALASSGEIGSETTEAASAIRQALEENKLDLEELLLSTAAGDSGSILSCAEALALDKDLLLLLLKNALKPALRAWQRQLAPLSGDLPWNSGHCFICGDVAAFAELQGNSQTMHLRCGSCGADWKFRRMQCVFCGNEEPETLRFIDTGSRNEIMRVEACEKCKNYIKVIASFDPLPAEMLAVQDLATLTLDYIALEHGYSRRAIR